MATPILSDTIESLLMIDDANLSGIDVTELLQDCTVLPLMPTVLASHDTLHKYTREIAAPGVGFRDINTGLDLSAGSDEQVTHALKMLDATVRRDKGLAIAAKGGSDAYMTKEGKKSLRAAFAAAEGQLLNGVGNITDGFMGLADFLDKTDYGMVVDAGGTGGKSVYIVRLAEDSIASVLGNEGNIDLGDIYGTTLTDGNGKPYSALAMDILAWLGMQFAYSKCAARIANLDGTTGHKLTSGMITQALLKFPAARPATHIIMNGVSLGELQASLTATRTDGAEAPIPENVQGIPIVRTDHLGIAETAVVATTTTTTTTTAA